MKDKLAKLIEELELAESEYNAKMTFLSTLSADNPMMVAIKNDAIKTIAKYTLDIENKGYKALKKLSLIFTDVLVSPSSEDACMESILDSLVAYHEYIETLSPYDIINIILESDDDPDLNDFEN